MQYKLQIIHEQLNHETLQLKLCKKHLCLLLHKYVCSHVTVHVSVCVHVCVCKYEYIRISVH